MLNHFHKLLLTLAGVFSVAFFITLNLLLSSFLSLPLLLALDLLILLSALALASHLGDLSIPGIKTLLKRSYYRAKYKLDSSQTRSQESSPATTAYLKILATLILLFKSAEEGFKIIQDEAHYLHGKAIILTQKEKQKFSKHHLNQLFRIHQRKKRRASAFSSAALLLFLLGSLLTAAFSTLVYQQISPTQAATFNWVQTDWSGGQTGGTADHNSDQTGWDQYYSKDSNINVSASGQISLSSTVGTIVETTDSDFNAGAQSGDRDLVISGGEVRLFKCGTDSVTDSEGNSYSTVQIGTQCWMGDNMNIGNKVNVGNMSDNGTIEKYCYYNNESYCDTYGGLYTWDEAMQYSTAEGAQGICPSSWHIPTDTEGHTLEDYLKDEGNICDPNRRSDWQCDPAGAKLKSGGSSGFKGLLAGYYGVGYGGLGTDGRFWFSSEDEFGPVFRTLGSDFSGIYKSSSTWDSGGFSVRCLTRSTNSGIFTSQVLNTSDYFGYIDFSWTGSTPGGTSISMEVRAGNTASPDGTWIGWTSVSNGGDISSLNGNQYIQYRATFSSNQMDISSSLEQVDISMSAADSLTSSSYNTTDATNSLGSLSWNETIPTDTDIKFRLRTSADGNTWTDWLGSDGATSTYFNDSHEDCEKAGDAVTCDIDEATVLGDTTDDQYIQYKAYLISETGANTPMLNSVILTYAVNATPEFESAPTTSQDSNGIVTINYSVRDPDTNLGSSNPGFVSPSFDYSLDGGSTWYEATSSCFSAGDWSDKAVSTSSYASYTATWDPSCETNISDTTHSTTTQIRVTVDDGEAANNTVSSTTAEFTLDTKSPVPGALPIYLDARRAGEQAVPVYLAAGDDTNMEMRLGLNVDVSDGSWISYSPTTTISLATDPDTVYVQFRDQYNNTSTIEHAVTPDSPDNTMIQDTSNMEEVPTNFRLFLAWQALSNPPNPGFDKYRIYHSTSSDPSTFSLTQTISDIDTNYWADNSIISSSTEHYYAITVLDDDGNESYYSEVLHGKANGVQDAGEGGGGTESTPPDYHERGCAHLLGLHDPGNCHLGYR